MFCAGALMEIEKVPCTREMINQHHMLDILYTDKLNFKSINTKNFLKSQNSTFLTFLTFRAAEYCFLITHFLVKEACRSLSFR